MYTFIEREWREGRDVYFTKRGRTAGGEKQKEGSRERVEKGEIWILL